jgi:hypothetical protein
MPGKAFATREISICLLSIAIAAACLVRLGAFPSVSAGGDAWGYVTYALRFREHGFLSELGSVRTYAYPAFLYLVSFLALPGGRGLWLCAGLLQYGLFVVVTLWLAKLVGRQNERLSLAVLIGLLLNPFLISIVVDCFTEGLLASFVVLLVVLALSAAMSIRTAGIAAAVFAGALASCLMMMIRPAAIPITLAWTVASFIAIWSSPSCQIGAVSLHRTRGQATWTLGRLQLAALNVVLLITAAFITWTPQIYYNYTTWGEMSFLPVCRFDAFQVLSSIPVLRYESVVNDTIVTPFFYQNPFSTADAIPGHPINWYINHPIAAAQTILLRLIAGLSINHLFTIVYPGQKLTELGVLSGYWTIICLGVMQIAGSAVVQIKNLRLTLPRQFNAAAVFITLSSFGALTLNSFTWIELRFNLVPIGALCVFGVYALLRRGGRFSRSKLVLCAVVAGCVLTAYSEFILSAYGTTGPVKNMPQAVLPPLKCYTFTSEAQ